VALGPVVTGARLAEHEVVGSEELTEGAGSNGVHGAGLEIEEDGAGDVSTTGGLVVVDVDSLELEIGVTVAQAQPSEPILFPKLRIYFADFPYLHCSIN